MNDVATNHLAGSGFALLRRGCLALALLALFGCGAAQSHDKRLPPPEYEEVPLPPYAPEQPKDPLAALLNQPAADPPAADQPAANEPTANVAPSTPTPARAPVAPSADSPSSLEPATEPGEPGAADAAAR